jgi:hypothetical protein
LGAVDRELDLAIKRAIAGDSCESQELLAGAGEDGHRAVHDYRK